MSKQKARQPGKPGRPNPIAPAHRGSPRIKDRDLCPACGQERGQTPGCPACKPPHWIHSSRLHVILYSLLLIFTPFVLLRNFLVEWISYVSMLHATVAGYEIPIVPSVAGGIALVGVILLRRHITRLRILAIALVVLLDALAQQITDYYFDHEFYDLQQNWHYMAYGLLAYMLYRDLAPRGYSLAGMILFTYTAALALSLFDELFQMKMSNRVFDICDTGKDVWGTVMGMVLVYLGGPRGPELAAASRRIRHRRLRDYLRQPIALSVWLTVFAFIFLIVGSLLSEVEYLGLVASITLATCVLVFVLVHLTQFRVPRYAIATLLVLALGALGYSAYRQRGHGISHVTRGLTVYAGVPIPIFDVLIFPDGSFRPVDKKHRFNNRDQRFLKKRFPDILLIGSGFDSRGGQGFPDQSGFIYNDLTRNPIQILVLPTDQACEVFNHLRREQRRVLFILHNGY